ncbi:MAG: hypothetical protein IPI43_32500 [Sandaracinaceae bacterium]|nr:hypothetical protein [Sandaracinaceae bacterium]
MYEGRARRAEPASAELGRLLHRSFYLASDANGTLVGCLAPCDLSPGRRIVVDDFPTAMRVAAGLARGLGKSVPQPGEELRILYLTTQEIDHTLPTSGRRAVFAALLEALYADPRVADYHMVAMTDYDRESMLDVIEPAFFPEDAHPALRDDHAQDARARERGAPPGACRTRDVSHLIPLNRSERAYAALEGVAGSVSQVYEMTFERPLDATKLRTCVRALITAFPRTRTRLVAGTLSTCLEVLDNTDPLLEPLFDEVFGVVHGVAANEERLHEYRNALLAEPFALGRSLPVRFRFADHPTRPTLFMIVHHLVCDGRGMIQMIDALLGALAGKPIEPVAIDRPFMRAALWPKGVMARLRAAMIDWRRMRAQKAAARSVTLIDPLAPLSAFTAPRVLRHTPKLSVKKLVAAAKAQDTSLNALTLAAVTLVLARRAGAAETVDTREVAVRISVDVRPYFDPPRPNAFGNFVASFMVRSTRFSDTAALLADVGAQLKEGVRR